MNTEIQNTLANWKQDKLWNYGKRDSMKDFTASKNYKVYIETWQLSANIGYTTVQY